VNALNDRFVTISANTSSLSSEQQATVRKELAAILASASFSGSKRCSDFLKYTVSRFLDGDIGYLTERFLGTELFGRSVDYETGTDSVVRVRATDVRRRLMQYNSGRRSEFGVVIEMPTGSYIPEFQWFSGSVKSSFEPSLLDSLSSPKPVLSDTNQPQRRIARRVLIGVGVILVFAISASTWCWHRLSSSSNTALERFWAPVIKNRNNVIVCFGDTISYWPSPEIRNTESQTSITPVGQLIITRSDQTTAGNIRSALSIINLLNRRGINTQLRWPQEVQPSDLASTDVIHIGAFNNTWTTSLNRDLRFSLLEVRTPSGSIWMIRDGKNPGRTWSTRAIYPEPISEDFALITRILDPEQKRVEISVGGLNMFGTQAAGEFLTNEASMAAFAHTVPKGWEKRNIQIVLAMDVSERRPVHPRIVATDVW